MKIYFTMPRKYVKRYRKRRSNGSYSRSTYSNKYAWYNSSNAVGLAQQALKTAKWVAGLVNVEKKFLDVSQIGVATASTGNIYQLSQITQGTDYNQRNGISVKVISHLLRMEYAINASAAYDFIRCILFVDKEQNASAPAVTDVLETATTDSPINHTNGQRFKILRDWKVNLSTGQDNASSRKYYMKMNHHVKFSGAASNTTKEGEIFMLVIGAQAVNVSQFSYYSRLRFVDN